MSIMNDNIMFIFNCIIDHNSLFFYMYITSYLHNNVRYIGKVWHNANYHFSMYLRTIYDVYKISYSRSKDRVTNIANIYITIC